MLELSLDEDQSLIKALSFKDTAFNFKELQRQLSVGRFDLQNWYPTLKAAVASFQAYGSDPAYQALMKNRAADPAGEIEGPWIGRMIHGAPKGIKPVIMHRDYHAPRSALPGILKLAPFVEVPAAI